MVFNKSQFCSNYSSFVITRFWLTLAREDDPFWKFLVAVILLPQFSRWPRRKRAVSRVGGVLFPSIPMATNLFGFWQRHASLRSCPLPSSPFISVICFRDRRRALFFSLSRAKEAKKPKKNNNKRLVSRGFDARSSRVIAFYRDAKEK